MITGGVCGYREYEDWVWAYLIQKDILKAAKCTLVRESSAGTRRKGRKFNKKLVDTRVHRGAGGIKNEEEPMNKKVAAKTITK